jgi:hypothetical protein
LAIVAVTVSSPAPVVFKILPPLILAPVSPASLTAHVIVLLVALEGDTVPVRVSGVPTVVEVGTLLMFVTAMKSVPLLPGIPPGSPQAAKVSTITAIRAAAFFIETPFCEICEIYKDGKFRPSLPKKEKKTIRRYRTAELEV